MPGINGKTEVKTKAVNSSFKANLNMTGLLARRNH
jgi:hypothetical protein